MCRMEFFTLITQVSSRSDYSHTRAKSVDISLRKKMKKKRFFVQILLQCIHSCQPINTIFETQQDGTQTLRTMC